MKTHFKSIAVLVAFIAMVSCQEKSPQGTESGPQVNAQAGTITLTREQTAAAGIELGSLESREMSPQIQVNGYIDVPPQNKAQVSAVKPGYVKNTFLLVGDKVRKGQALVVLENPDFVKLQQNFMEVKGQLDYLESEYERKKILESENITARRNLLKAEADYKTALAQYQGLQKELQLMGISTAAAESGNYTSTITVYAPIGGTITKVNALIGKYIPPQELIVEIVDTRHLHVELRVFEKDATKVREGQKIKLRIPSLDDKVYGGAVFLVGKSLDEASRSVNIHGHIEEDSANFLPGMYVEASILLGNKSVAALPQEAVVGNAQGAFIFARMQENESSDSYQRLAVTTGLTGDGWVEVLPLDSLAYSYPIVTRGVYYLSSYLGNEEP